MQPEATMLLALDHRGDSYLIANIMRACDKHLFDYADGLRLRLTDRPSLELINNNAPAFWPEDGDEELVFPLLAVDTMRESPVPYARRVAMLTFTRQMGHDAMRAIDQSTIDRSQFVGALLHLCTGCGECDNPPLQTRWRSERNHVPAFPNNGVAWIMIARHDDSDRHKISSIRLVPSIPHGNNPFEMLWRAATSSP